MSEPTGEGYKLREDILPEAEVISAEEAGSTAETALSTAFETAFALLVELESGQILASPDQKKALDGALHQALTSRPGKLDDSYPASIIVSGLWLEASQDTLQEYGQALAESEDPPAAWERILLRAADVPRMRNDPDVNAADLGDKNEFLITYAEDSWARRAKAGTFPPELYKRLAQKYIPIWYGVGQEKEGRGLWSRMNGQQLCAVCAVSTRVQIELVADSLSTAPKT